jgi:hypothetical protein
MSLNKTQLKNSIQLAFDSQKGKTENQASAINDLAQKIADAVEVYVKSITVTSIPVLTAPPGGGPVTGTITNSIS